MTLIYDIGGAAGNNFATPQLAMAAVPATQTEDWLYRVNGANADGSVGSYSGQVTAPTVETSNYTLTLRGMLGSMWAGGQATINSSGNGIYNNNGVYRGAWLIADNLNIVAGNSAWNYGVYAYGCAAWVNGCRVSAYVGAWTRGRSVVTNSSINGVVNGLRNISSSYASFQVTNSIITALTGSALENTLAGALASGLHQCTLVAPYVFSIYDGTENLHQLRCTNSILLATTRLVKTPNSDEATFPSTYWQAFLSSLHNCNAYCTADGKLIGGLTLAEIASGYEAMYPALLSADPLFVNASGTYSLPSDFALGADSPCRRLNQTIRTSGVNPSAQIERVTPGAPIDSWDEAPLAESAVLYGNTYAGGTKNGRWHDLADIADVRLGTAWGVDGASRVGTLDLNADAPTVPALTLVDNGDETATATISGADAGTTNTVYYAEFGTDTWLEAGEVVGNGTVALDLGAGAFSLQVQSKLGAGCSATTPVLFRIKPAAGEAAIITAAEDIKNALIGGSFSQAFTPERTFIKDLRTEKIPSGISVWINPIATETSNGTRGKKDNQLHEIEVCLCKKAATDAEKDELAKFMEELYEFLRHRELTEGRKVESVEIPELYSTEWMLERGFYVSSLAVQVREIA